MPRMSMPLGQFNRFGLVFALTAALGLSGCDTTSDVVDALNPSDWFDSDDSANEEPAPVPGDGGPYPSIGQVPDRPEDPAIRREYLSLAEVLAADRENARYTDEVIRRESPPSRRTEAALPVAPPPEPPTATIIEPPPEETQAAPQPAPEPAPVVVAEEVAAAPQPAAPQPAPAPEPVVAAQAPAPAPAPAPEPLAVQPEAPTPATQPPSSAADLAADTSASSAAATQTAALSEVQMIATIYFPNGGAGLTERDRGILRQVADIYRRDGGRRVVIVGHSSQSGAAGSQSEQALVNYKVSLDRAAAVGQTLVESGIPIDQIVVDARGANELKYSEETAAGEAGNRRAEVFLQY